MIDEEVPKVQPRSGAAIDQTAYQTLCRLFPYPQNAFQQGAFIRLLEYGGLEKLGLTYGVKVLPYGEEAKFDPAQSEILLSEGAYFGLKMDEPRARFTFAHELGHAVMHGDFLKTGFEGRVPRKLYKRTTLPAYLDPEWQANRFAGGFLMPDPIMGKCVREGWSDAKIAKYFNVSLQAAQIRRAKMVK